LSRELGLENCVNFPGALLYHEVPKALAACDVFASASTSEVHPLTFIEAMAAGLPCVGIPSPGVSDTIRDGENGWLCTRENFARVLASALLDRNERARRAANALADSAAYSSDETVESTLALYRETLQGAWREAVI
jgi:1,2-diacylglycerol 3-alpha-glucosyltransferase